MRKFKNYNEGDSIGSFGCLFVRDLEFKSGQKRKSILKCKCGNNFEHDLSTVSLGRRRDCGCEQTIVNKIGYKYGQFIGNNKCIFIEYTKGRVYAKIKCHCGNEFNSQIDPIVRGSKLSCGCIKSQMASLSKKTHGMTGTVEEKAWNSIKFRISNPNCKGYKNYGGRGITMSEEWRNSFDIFLKDMGMRPSEKHSVDRIDNSKGYCKENCRWATQEEQANNKRSNIKLYYNGETLTISQWAKKLGFSKTTIGIRLKSGLDIDKVLSHVRLSSKK